MKVAFRADASLQMGSGHVMRCLTLANALREKGAECHFLFREHPGHMLAQIRAAGHIIHPLALTPRLEAMPEQQNILAHAGWLGASQSEDAQQSIDVLRCIQPDWLVVDHYALDVLWHKALRPFTKRLMVIDDLADRSHDCDLLLDQTFGRNGAEYHALVPEGCSVLCGSRFALLRPEFPLLRLSSLARRADLTAVKQVLITMGGVDQANATTQVLKTLAGMEYLAGLQITVVMGGRAPWLHAVRQQVLQLPLSAEVLVDSQNMAELMARADLAIGAAGSTAWERCSLGLPSIMVVLAENQLTVAAGLQEAGAAQVIACVEDIPGRLPALLAPLFNEPHRLNQMSAAAAQVTNGEGVQAVIQAFDVWG
jgi:UDP-2,4-diacetamido-2,4,6-trideoxy-beta-L-altropyranose hydrolase